MPLVKNGKITGDEFVHVADDAEIPGDGAILISAARFLGDRGGAVAAAAGKTGVIWPNNRDLDDLVPYLDRLAVVALVFPTFRDGRAYSQARLLRERHGYRGELRATGQVLRDQFVFMLRAGFDAFEVKKDSRRGGVCQYRQALLGVLPADRRRPRHRAAPADAVASFGECQPVSMLVHQASPRTSAIVPPAQELDRALRDASPAEVIAAALQTVGRERLALVSSFGTESAALLKVMADVDPAIPVVFLDTGWLFEETLAYRDTLIATLGLRDVRSIKPLEETLSREDPDRELWFSDPDACCRIRKVEPLARALKPFGAWINGRKRFQGGAARRHSRRRGGRRQAEIQSVRQRLARRDRGDLHACKPAAASAGGVRLSVGRLHALHQPDLARRRRARRPLARQAKTECGIHTIEDFVAQ